MVNEIIVKENDKYLINGSISKQIADFEREIKRLTLKKEKLRDMILKEMEEKDILSLENDDLKITYIGETCRTTFDSAKFKKEHEDLYKEYCKDNLVKSSVRITVKEQENE